MRIWNDRTWYRILGFAALMGCGREPVSVVLITLDTTRADHLGCYGAVGIETPEIDGLARRGVLFETALAPVPTTLPSHTSIMTSLHPFAHRVRDNGIFRVNAAASTLAEVLQAQGYRTGAVVSAFVLESQFGLDQGFSQYDDRVSSSAFKTAGTQDRRAEGVTAAALEFLQGRGDAPFFLWLHYFDAHAPYDPPSPFKERYAGRPYDGEIASIDSALKRVLDELSAPTLIVLTADHGESLGEHGERTHGYFLYEATARVPLIMAGPGLPAGRRIAGVASLVDIMPTILDALGLPIPEQCQGQSLLTAARSGAPLPARQLPLETYAPYYNFGWSPLTGLRDERYKYIRAPQCELYDLADDPGEEHNLLAQQGDVAARLARSLEHLLASYPGPRLAEHNAPSSADSARLAELGYTAVAAAGDPQPTGPDPKDMIDLLGHRDRGRTLLVQGRNDEAIAAFTLVLDRNPENAQVREFLGTALAAKGLWREARDELLRAVALRPALYTAHYNLALCYAALGDQAARLLHLQAAYHHNPRYIEPARDLALAYTDAHDPTNAHLWLDRCKQILGPQSPDFRELAARIR